MENIPDSWVIVKIKGANETYYKVLAGWSGGYTYGDSWQLNSGITAIDDEGEYYTIHGASSSVYKCYKYNEELRMSIAGVYNQLKERFGDDVTIVEIKDVDSEYFLEVNGG